MEKPFIIVVVLAFALMISSHLLPIRQSVKMKEKPVIKKISLNQLDKTKVYEVLRHEKGKLIIREKTGG